MARIPYVDVDSAPEPVRMALASAPKSNLLNLLAHAETCFVPRSGFTKALLTQLKLAPRARELVILRVAVLTPGADYEWLQHEQIAREVGLSEQEIESARTGKGLDSDAELLIRFTDEVVHDARASDETFAAIADRFSPREIIELLLVIGQYMALGRIMATTQVDLEVVDRSISKW